MLASSFGVGLRTGQHFWWGLGGFRLWAILPTPKRAFGALELPLRGSQAKAYLTHAAATRLAGPGHCYNAKVTLLPLALQGTKREGIEPRSATRQHMGLLARPYGPRTVAVVWVIGTWSMGAIQGEEGLGRDKHPLSTCGDLLPSTNNAVSSPCTRGRTPLLLGPKGGRGGQGLQSKILPPPFVLAKPSSKLQ